MRIDEFITENHTSTKRDYVARVNEYPKAECAKIAKRYDKEFWDGDRRYGYGGYIYDGRWESVAKKLIGHYGLESGMNVLDIGCGKAHLLYEIKKEIPNIQIEGIDISEYALTHTIDEVKPFIHKGSAQELSGYQDKQFDLVISLNTLHNLKINELLPSIREIQRISKDAYIVVESWETEEERVNLMYWQLTCASFYDVSEWEWIYKQCGYTGDYGFIFFD